MTITKSVETIEFREFKKFFQNNFDQVIKDQTHLFVVDLDRDTLWNAYLDAFPGELRQSFNCNSCRQFLKKYAGLVAIKDNQLVTLWNFRVPDDIYQAVVDNLDRVVSAAVVKDVFVTKQAKLGIDYNFQDESIKWHHFYYELPKTLVNRTRETEDSIKNELRNQKEVFKRSLEEITVDAVSTVLELASPTHNVYRLAEFVPVVKAFQKCQQEYASLPDSQKDNYCWITSLKQAVAVSKIRNTAVGTLLQDLSADLDINEAVRKFKKVMDPNNYHRVQNITYTSPKQLEKAKERIIELGLEESLGRRFATSQDITVNNVIYVDRAVKTKSSGSLLSDLVNEIKEDITVNPKELSKLETITISDFIENVVPKVNSIELLLENRLAGNLVSLIAPENLDSPSLFKWDNGFSLSYRGGLADSMKERVKAAGGKVDGVLRFSIQWNDNGDDNIDFDAHAKEPNGTHIYFRTYKGSRYTLLSGNLDVDVVSPKDKVAVENICWSNLSKMQEGRYKFWVHNFSSKTSNRGFSAEIEYGGEIYSFSYPNSLRGGQEVVVAEIEFSKTTGIKFISSLQSTSAVSSKKLWNLSTNKFHRVNILMLSPNYWNGQGIGNQHYLFMLEGCKADEARGFFNEFLRQDLVSERKFFEVLANKLNVPPSDDQLSGLGFSTTQKADFVVKVTGSFTRMLRVTV